MVISTKVVPSDENTLNPNKNTVISTLPLPRNDDKIKLLIYNLCHLKIEQLNEKLPTNINAFEPNFI